MAPRRPTHTGTGQTTPRDTRQRERQSTSLAGRATGKGPGHTDAGQTTPRDARKRERRSISLTAGASGSVPVCFKVIPSVVNRVVKLRSILWVTGSLPGMKKNLTNDWPLEMSNRRIVGGA